MCRTSGWPSIYPLARYRPFLVTATEKRCLRLKNKAFLLPSIPDRRPVQPSVPSSPAPPKPTGPPPPSTPCWCRPLAPLLAYPPRRRRARRGGYAGWGTILAPRAGRPCKCPSLSLLARELSGNYCYQESRFRTFGLRTRRPAFNARQCWLERESNRFAAFAAFRRLS